MNEKPTPLRLRLRGQLFHLVFGLSIGSGALLMAGACPTFGQCAACGACLSGLPLLAVPLLARRLKAGDGEEPRVWDTAEGDVPS